MSEADTNSGRVRNFRVLARFVDHPTLGEAVELLFFLRNKYDEARGNTAESKQVLDEVDEYLGRVLEPRREI